MKILVYGAGNIGSLYAALLKEAGRDVSMLARGRRLADIREHGLELEEATSGAQVTTSVRTIDRYDPEEAYDLVLVVLPRDRIAEALPILAANRHAPSVMFFGNNAAGARELTEALGAERVLLGFPGAAAVSHEHRLRYVILSAREQPTTIGELDGTRSARIDAIAHAFEVAGFPVSVCPNMDAWLKTHAVEISPTASALYMAGTDVRRLARTPDALLLMLRAIREGYAILAAHGIPVTPRSHAVFRWLPEPLLLFVMRRATQSETASLKIGHALEARHEMGTIAEEIRTLAAAASVPTPALDRLHQYLDPAAQTVPDGSAEIPVNWNAVWMALGALAISATLLSLAL